MKAQRLKPENGWQAKSVDKDFTVWQKGDYIALSSVVEVEDEHLPLHEEWLISFSKFPMQVMNGEEIAACLKDFNASDFLEDNHEKGFARKFWKAVDEKYRKPCPCKDEIQIVNGDYTYSVKGK